MGLPEHDSISISRSHKYRGEAVRPDNYVSRPYTWGGEERGARSIGTDIMSIRSRGTLDPLTPRDDIIIIVAYR